MSDEAASASTQDDSGDDVDIIYAFSSVSRELYIQDIYNSLALPPKFTIEFRYREPWYDDRIGELMAQDDLVGRDLVIIAAPFTEYDSNTALARDVQYEDTKYGFYPLRRAEITAVRNPGDVLYLTLEMSAGLVNYDAPVCESSTDNDTDDPWDLTSDLNAHPKFGVEETDSDVFLTCGPNKFEFLGSRNEYVQQHLWTTNQCEEYWNRIVRELGNTESLSETLFYRIESINGMNPPNRVDPDEIFETTNIGYLLNSGTQYLLELSLVYAGSAPDEAQDATISIQSGQNVQILPSEFNLGFRTDQKEIIIDPNTGIKETNTSLSIGVTADFYAPEVNIPLRITPKKRDKRGPPAIFLLGIVAILLNTHLSNLINSFGPFPEIPVLVNLSNVALSIQLLGTFMIIAGMHFYAAFREIDL